MTVIRFTQPEHVAEDAKRDGDNPGTFDEAAERLAILKQMKELKTELSNLSDRVFASFSVERYDRVYEHLSDAMKSVDTAAGFVIREDGKC